MNAHEYDRSADTFSREGSRFSGGVTLRLPAYPRSTEMRVLEVIVVLQAVADHDCRAAELLDEGRDVAGVSASP